MGNLSRASAAGVQDAGVPWRAGSTTWLLDVNVLLALLDPIHTHHALAHDWFADAGASWASCCITQNGALRIMSHPRYGNAVASAAIAACTSFVASLSGSGCIMKPIMSNQLTSDF